MIDFKKPIEIFRINADATFELGKGADPLVALGELSKAFMKQQERIKRLEEAGDALANHHLLVVTTYDKAKTHVSDWNKAKEAKP